MCSAVYISSVVEQLTWSITVMPVTLRLGSSRISILLGSFAFVLLKRCDS